MPNSALPLRIYIPNCRLSKKNHVRSLNILIINSLGENMRINPIFNIQVSKIRNNSDFQLNKFSKNTIQFSGKIDSTKTKALEPAPKDVERRATNCINEAENIMTSTIEAAEAIKTRACELQKSVENKVDYVINLYNNGGKDVNGNTVAKFSKTSHENEVTTTMEELAKDGKTIARKSTFIQGELCKIEEFTENGKKNVCKFGNGKLAHYEEGCEAYDGTEKIEKILKFDNNDELESYKEGYKHSQYCTKTSKSIDFISGQSSLYKEGSEYYGAAHKKEEVYAFILNGKLSGGCRIGVQHHKDGTTSTTKGVYVDKNGRLSHYQEGCRTLSDGTSRIEQELRYNNAVPSEYTEVVETFGPLRNAEKEYVFNEGKLYVKEPASEHINFLRMNGQA